MKYCAKCGKELSDDDIICVGCGCSVNNPASVATAEAAPVKPARKINKVWIIAGAVVVLLGVIAAILFMPRNLKLDDFKKSNVATAILRYGLPDHINKDAEGGVCLLYEGNISFYGFEANVFFVYPDQDKISFWFPTEDGRNLYNLIDRRCDLEDNLLDIFHIFSYGDLEITTYDYDGSSLTIKMY